MILRYEGLRLSLLEPSHIYPVHVRVNHDQPSRNALTGMNASNPNGKMAHAKTVLVLDADVLVRMSIVQLLRECGYRVLEAAKRRGDYGVAEDGSSDRCGIKPE